MNRGDMSMHRNLSGAREIRVERANGSRVFVGRGNRGYVQRPFIAGGREFAHRTYYAHGVAYDRFYRTYSYRGVHLEGYAPVRYYAPLFYGYAYAPFAVPVPYAWGWAGTPWGAYYGTYFTPYAVYPSPAFWLADYMISTSLAESYQAQLDAANGAPPQPFATPPTPLAPYVQQQIAEEVRRQIAIENTEASQIARNTEIDPASSGIVRMLSDNTPHVFVAGADLDVLNTRGQECLLGPGDVIQLNGPTPPNVNFANLVVLASKPRECMKGDIVSVGFADLQDMQNHMRETIDQGLGTLQSRAGKDGLPPIPASARVAPVDAPFAPIAPPPDPNAASEIARQAREADNAERDVAGQWQTPAGQGYPASQAQPGQPVRMGDTFDQVTAALGKPVRTLQLGNSTIYFFEKSSVNNSPINVVFDRDGKVIDIQ